MPVIQQPSCPSCCDGIISVEASGGTNVTFSIDGGNTWFPPSVFGGSHRVFDGLCVGVYNAAIRYYNNGKLCTATTAINLEPLEGEGSCEECPCDTCCPECPECPDTDCCLDIRVFPNNPLRFKTINGSCYLISEYNRPEIDYNIILGTSRLAQVSYYDKANCCQSNELTFVWRLSSITDITIPNSYVFNLPFYYSPVPIPIGGIGGYNLNVFTGSIFSPLGGIIGKGSRLRSIEFLDPSFCIDCKNYKFKFLVDIYCGDPISQNLLKTVEVELVAINTTLCDCEDPTDEITCCNLPDGVGFYEGAPEYIPGTPVPHGYSLYSISDQALGPNWEYFKISYYNNECDLVEITDFTAPANAGIYGLTSPEFGKDVYFMINWGSPEENYYALIRNNCCEIPEGQPAFTVTARNTVTLEEQTFTLNQELICCNKCQGAAFEDRLNIFQGCCDDGCCDEVDIEINGGTYNYNLSRITNEILQIENIPIAVITPNCCNGNNTIVFPEQVVRYIDHTYNETPISIYTPSTINGVWNGGSFEITSVTDVLDLISFINYEEDCIDPETGEPLNTGFTSQGGYIEIEAEICGVERTIRIPVLPRKECCAPCEETLLVINEDIDGYGTGQDRALRFFPVQTSNTLDNTIIPENGTVINNQLVAYIPLKSTCGCEINIIDGDWETEIYYDSFGGNIIEYKDVLGTPAIQEENECQSGFTIDSIVFEPEIPSVQEARFVIYATKTGNSSGQVRFSTVTDCGNGNNQIITAYRYFGEAEPIVVVGGPEGTSGPNYYNYISSGYFEPITVNTPITFIPPFYTFGQPQYPEITDYNPTTPATYLGQAQSPGALNNRVFNYQLPVSMTVTRNCATYPVIEVFPEKLVRHDLLTGITRPDFETYTRCFEQYCFYQFTGDITNGFRPYAAGAGPHKDLTAFIEERGLINFDIDEFTKTVNFTIDFGSYRPLGIRTTESQWDINIISNPEVQQYHLYLRLRYYPLENYKVYDNAFARTRHYDEMVIIRFSVQDFSPL